MPRVNLTVAMLRNMAAEFGEQYAAPEQVIFIEESTGTDAYGMIVRYQPPGDERERKILVTDFGAVRIA